MILWPFLYYEFTNSKMMTYSLLGFMLICIVRVSFSYAWFDEGHMLVGTIARMNMHMKDVEVIEKFLSYWEEQYPGTSNLYFAPCWADHIKCARDAKYCRGFPRFDGFYLFDTFHYVSIPNFVKPISPTHPLEDEPYHQTGATYALTNLYETLSHTSKHNCGSIFSINLSLRLFTHIFGDIHQPLHCVDNVSQCYPRGDKGGDAMHLEGEDNCPNLHHYWDSAGETATGTLSYIDANTLMEKASQLMEKYPMEYFGERVNIIDYQEISKESFDIAVKIAYSDFDLSHCTSNPRFQLSEEYKQTVRETSNTQIVLGGYRLAKLLTTLAHHLQVALHDIERQTVTSVYS